MDANDPQLQKAIYASIQSARKEGVPVHGGRLQPSSSPVGGTGGRSGYAAPPSGRTPRPVHSASQTTLTRTNPSSTFGRVDSLRRSGIAPVSKASGAASPRAPGGNTSPPTKTERAADLVASNRVDALLLNEGCEPCGTTPISGHAASPRLQGTPAATAAAAHRRTASPPSSTSASSPSTALVQQTDPFNRYDLGADDDPSHVAMIMSDVVRPPNSTGQAVAAFDDIAGLENAKRLLNEAVTLPLLIPEYFRGIREPWRGVLLFGPPGNGKSRLAAACAAMHPGVRFFNVSIATLTSKWRGDSEKLLRTLFNMARRGGSGPAVLFFDEIDALAGSRGAEGEHEASRRFKSELLAQMDGLGSATAAAVGGGAAQPTAAAAPGAPASPCLPPQQRHHNQVIVLAATNRPWDLDEALRRRLEKRIYVPLPDAASRRQMFHLHLRGLALGGDVDLDALAAQTDGRSGADIRLACKDAALMPMRRLIAGKGPAEIRALQEGGQLEASAVTMDDLQVALRRAAPTVAAAEVARYEQWHADFASV